jgi:hypothetical protein
MSVDIQLPQTHFTEIIAKNLNSELINLARPGASNFYIGLQVEHAIQQHADLILILFSNYDRIQILQENCQYRVEQGITNIVNNAVDTANARVFSNVITNFIDQSLLTPEQIDVLKPWFTNIYNFGLFYHQDWFVCQGILSRAKQSGIPFVFNTGGMRYYGHNETWDYYLNYQAGENPWNYVDSASINSYHTLPNSQQIIASNWLKKFEKNYQKD